MPNADSSTCWFIQLPTTFSTRQASFTPIFSTMDLSRANYRPHAWLPRLRSFAVAELAQEFIARSFRFLSLAVEWPPLLDLTSFLSETSSFSAPDEHFWFLTYTVLGNGCLVCSISGSPCCFLSSHYTIKCCNQHVQPRTRDKVAKVERLNDLVQKHMASVKCSLTIKPLCK